jgi:hypothetical protein
MELSDLLYDIKVEKGISRIGHKYLRIALTEELPKHVSAKEVSIDLHNKNLKPLSLMLFYGPNSLTIACQQYKYTSLYKKKTELNKVKQRNHEGGRWLRFCKPKLYYKIRLTKTGKFSILSIRRRKSGKRFMVRALKEDTFKLALNDYLKGYPCYMHHTKSLFTLCTNLIMKEYNKLKRMSDDQTKVKS